MNEAWRWPGISGLKDKVAGRREERQRFIKVAPPPFLGILPAEGTETIQPEPQRMVGHLSTSRPDEGAQVLRGVAGSRG